jgi:hypothetical protein
MRDHLDRVRLSTLRGSEVQQMIAANGSSLGKSKRHKPEAQRARLMARSSAAHQITRSNTALRYP